MSLGHASLFARLATSQRVEVVSVSRSVNDTGFDRDEMLASILRSAGSDADVAIGVYVWNEGIVQWLLPSLRERGFAGRIILGGPQITYASAGVLALYPAADVAIRGYGEDALAAVASCSAPLAIDGVVWRGGPDSTASASPDLLTSPSPILSGVTPVQRFMRWETQRGCIYACSFCQHRESGGRARQRVLAGDRVRAEADALLSGGADDIAVLDPIFHTNPAAVDILGRFARGSYTGRLSLQSRFELVDDAFLDACADLNVRLEFGLQTIHRAEMRAVRRPNDLDTADDVIAKLHARAIPFEVSLIYGLPAQTLTSFEASVRWCRERAVPVVRAFPLMLLRGTGLDLERNRWGLIESDDTIPVVVASNSFTFDECARMREIAEGLGGDSIGAPGDA